MDCKVTRNRRVKNRDCTGAKQDGRTGEENRSNEDFRGRKKPAQGSTFGKAQNFTV